MKRILKMDMGGKSSVDIKISDVITKDTVDLKSPSFNNKEELFNHLASLLYKAGKLESQEDFVVSLYEREKLGSTYMGNFIAIPHGKSTAVNSPGIAFCRCDKGFNYESMDEVGEVKLIFALAIPKDTDPNAYLKVLSTLAKLLMHEEFVDKLYGSSTYEDVISAINKFEPIVND